MTDSIPYTYEDGDHEEIIDFTQKNVAEESAAQITRHLQALDVKPNMIDRVDHISGGDHGQGAFIAGSRIVISLGDEDAEPISFEISVAEIVCKKDNADILKKTIKDELTKGFDTLAKNDLVFRLNANDQIECSFVPASENDTAAKSLRANMYIVGDLAFYGMILGKEGMSGKWCHLCKLSAKEFADLTKSGDPWVYEAMDSLGKWYREKINAKKKADPKMGMKEEPWFTMIPIGNFIVPLLHCLIGIGDNMLTKFRDIVSEFIEYLPREEVDMRLSQGAMEQKIDDVILERVTFDKTEEGKKLKSLKGKVTRSMKSLKKLGIFNSVPGVASTASISPNQEFLDEIMEFIDMEAGDDAQDDEEDEDDGQDDGTNGQTIADYPQPITIPAGSSRELTDVEKRINEINKIIEDSMREIEPLKKKRAKIANRLKNARAYLKKIKNEIKDFKKSRRKSGDGIEAEMFKILKIRYGIKMQAYHGGTMTGKDIQKFMSNAAEIFSLFAGILKAN
ncbi:hypothetical protein ACHAXR_001674, partial [Thalassiosira sp. AJA248-18]